MRIHHLALRTQDLPRLARFYEQALGLEANPQGGSPGRSVWLRAGSTVIMLERASEGEPPLPGGSGELVAFAVDDREAWRRRLEQSGVAIEAETAHTLYFRDPDGRRLAVSTYPL